MRAFKPKRKDAPLNRKEALNCKPVKNAHVRETRLESGEARLEYPARIRPMIVSLIRLFGASTDGTYVKKLQLDAMGTEVWQLIDGMRTARQIIQRFGDAHRLHGKEAEVSVTSFLRELGKRGIIGLK